LAPAEGPPRVGLLLGGAEVLFFFIQPALRIAYTKADWLTEGCAASPFSSA
jgi:hypothetical protein